MGWKRPNIWIEKICSRNFIEWHGNIETDRKNNWTRYIKIAQVAWKFRKWH